MIRSYGTSGLQIQNLDPSERATMDALFYDQRGGEPVRVSRPDLEPGSAGNYYLRAEIGRASYAAIATADRPIRTLVRTDWDISGAAAMYGDAQPGMRIVVPVFSGFKPGTAVDPDGRLAGRISSVVHVQNTLASQRITATLTLRDEAGASLLESTLGIGPGTSVSLDHAAASPLAALPYGSAGSLEIRAETPLAVASHLDVWPWPHAAMAFDALPAERAATRLLAPLVSSGALSTWIAVQNPGQQRATLRLIYQRNGDASGDACGDAPLLHGGGEQSLPAGGLLFLSQARGGGSGLPAACLASAEIQSDQPLTAVVMAEDADAGSAAAYAALDPGDASREMALPRYYNQYTRDRLTTSIQVMNPSDSSVNLVLRVYNSEGKQIPCPGCSENLPPRSARLWNPPLVEGLREQVGVYGSAFVEADGPILAIVADASLNDARDTAFYAGHAICLPQGGPSAVHCRNQNFVPHTGYGDFGWVMPRPPGEVFLPAAWRD